jgi:putative membrane protein
MNSTDLIFLEWHPDLTAIIIVVLLVAFHYFSNGRKLTSKSPYFLSGIVLLLLVTQSPIEYLGHGYLFSAHMFQHVTILLIVPPMLLAGTDGDYLGKILNRRMVVKTGHLLFNPLIAWTLGVGSMWFWHIPGLIMAMKNSQWLMTVHFLSLLVLGIIFIWPVYAPVKFGKLTPLQCALYLFTACVGCTTLGIFITFGPEGLYTSHLMGHETAVWNLIRSDWGISPAMDQKIGGLIMWVPACIVYVINTMVTLGKWISSPAESNDVGLPAADRQQIIPGEHLKA